MAAPMVDTHNHFWDIENSDLYWMLPGFRVLQRTYTPDDLRPHMEAVGVGRSVIVQASKSQWDHMWYFKLADDYGFVAAVVGWADLENPHVGSVLDGLRQHPAFRGVRATAENEPDVDWLARPEVRRGIAEVSARGLTLDLLVNTPHLRHVPRLAEENPDLQMVVDHLAKPPIAQGELDEWYRGVEALVPYTNVWLKVSGLLTEAGAEPTAEKIRPVVRFVLERFGPDRLMWGSDWPVCLLAADYEATFRTVSDALGELSDEDRAALYGGNGARFYRLD